MEAEIVEERGLCVVCELHAIDSDTARVLLFLFRSGIRGFTDPVRHVWLCKVRLYGDDREFVGQFGSANWLVLIGCGR